MCTLRRVSFFVENKELRRLIPKLLHSKIGCEIKRVFTKLVF